MDFRIAIIDGSGPFCDKEYSSAMNFSFCSQINIQAQKYAASRYERGPSGEGYRMNERGDRAAKYLLEEHAKGARRLMLAGYSRGASAAIMAAEVLQTKKVQVQALFLFDPVARHASRGGEVVPANVAFVRIARRKLDQNMIKKYDYTIGPYGLPIMHNPMRVFFGTTAVKYVGNGDHKTAEFRGSHGALGGVGWKHVTEDGPCQVEVAKFMNDAFQAVRLPFDLQALAPTTVA